jgi:hypothetical protein
MDLEGDDLGQCEQDLFEVEIMGGKFERCEGRATQRVETPHGHKLMCATCWVQWNVSNARRQGSWSDPK